MAANITTALDALSAKVQTLIAERDAIDAALQQGATPQSLTTRINALERACHALNRPATKERRVREGELEDFTKADWRDMEGSQGVRLAEMVRVVGGDRDGGGIGDVVVVEVEVKEKVVIWWRGGSVVDLVVVGSDLG